MEHNSDDHLLTYPAAAARLGISKRSLERLVANGDIAYIQVGGSIRFDPTDLDEYVDLNRRTNRAIKTTRTTKTRPSTRRVRRRAA